MLNQTHPDLGIPSDSVSVQSALVASSEETPEFTARLEQWRDQKGKHRDAYKRLSRRQRATAAASR